MRKVLIVSPHFPPVNAPDMQRVRLALPHLRALGWDPVVLAIDPSLVEGAVLDEKLAQTYPADIRVVRVRGIPPRFTRWAGFGNLWLRCGRALRLAGERLLREENFDLVFFSTTQFDAFTLGPVWKKRFGVPYVLDYQDPWYNDYYERTKTRPPGGYFKFGVSQWRARRQEPRALRGASGVVTVSPSYPETLARAYPWFDADRAILLPFGAAARDFDLARGHLPAEPLVNFCDGHFHHVYVGRCGPDMSNSLTILFRAFKLFLESHPEQAEKIRFHFIGTDYAPGRLAKEWAMPIARAENMTRFANEHPGRVSYFDALYYLAKADAVLTLGSNDTTYSASKVFPCVLAHRPLLSIFHEKSPILAFLDQIDYGRRFSFNNDASIEELTQTIHREWFVGGGMRQVDASDLAAFAPFTAENMTIRLAAAFDAATDRPGSAR